MTLRTRLIAFAAVALLAIGAAFVMPGHATSDASASDAEASEVVTPIFASSFFRSTRVDAAGTEQTEWLGSMVIWILLGGSAAGVGLIIQLSLANTRQTILPESAVRDVRAFIEQGQRQEAMHYTTSDDSFFSAISNAALRRADDGRGAMLQSLTLAAEERTTERLRRVEYLNVLGQVSPMLGLFGTVYGMILAFQAIVATGGQADPVMLAGGIGTALVTTFWGLVVAIPALAGYALLRNRIDALTMEAAIEAEELLTLLTRTEPAVTKAKSA